MKTTLRPYSTKTRIETQLSTKPESGKPVALRPYSTKTRIETHKCRAEKALGNAFKTVFH